MKIATTLLVHSISVLCMAQATVQLRFVERKDKAKYFEIVINNTSDHAIYATVNPMRFDRSRGPYFSAEAGSSLLRCEFRTYGPPDFDLYVNDTRVQLRKILPGAELRERFSVSSPVVRTMPPYAAKPAKREAFPNEFSKLQAVVGILSDSELAENPAKLRDGSIVTGYEPLRNNHPIFEIQHLVSSPEIDF